MGINRRLMRIYFFLTTALAVIYGNQLTFFYIKLILSHYLPFVKATAAQAFAFVFLFWTGAFKFNHITHIGAHLQKE